MIDSESSRRGVLKGALGLTCATCAVSGLASAAEPATAASSESVTAEWNVLDVDGFPFSIRYRPGYESDAEQVREWAIFAYDCVQDVYSHELSEPITFDLYPAEEYSNPHGNMVYSENTLSASMVTPSEYDGSYSDKSLFYRHGVTHEYTHAAQNDGLDFHTHANWMMEGFAEAVSVYHTDEAIYNEYHNEHRRARATRRDIQRGFGYVLGVNEYVYRGSMQLLEFMFEEYGSQAVGEVFEQDAKNMVEAIQMRLDITPLDLEEAWLTYAQREIGGDYTEQIERLGGTVSAFLSLDSARSFDSGSIEIGKAVYLDDDYALVVFDESMDAIGSSETFAQGEQVTNVEVSLDGELAEPQQLTVRLHHADGSGYGEPVEISGSRVSESVMYSTSPAAIKFATPPAAGDTTVTVDAFVAGDFETDDDVMLRVMDGESDRLGDRISDSFENLVPGASVAGMRIGLDESTATVPLSDGQTITANLISDSDDTTIASATRDVGETGDSARSQQRTSSDRRSTNTAGEMASDDRRTSNTDREMTNSDRRTGAHTDADPSTETTGGSGPGFGILGTLAGFGSASYLLRSRTDEHEDS